MHSGGVAAKDRFGGAERLDHVPPVDPHELSQAGDGVADGGVVGGLVMAFGLLDQFEGLPAFGQLLLDPVDHQPHGRMRSQQAGGQLGQER